MTCSQCGGPLAEDAAACPQCGAPAGSGAASQTPAHTSPPAATAGPGAAVQGFNFDLGRLSQVETITGIASVVLLISLFLPWFGWDFSYLGVHESGSISGMSAHGYLWLVFLLCVGIVAFLVLGAGFEELPFTMPMAREMVLLIATGVNLVLVLLAFFVNGLSLVDASGVGWSAGAFIGLLAAIVACTPLALPMIRASANRT